MNNSNLPKDEEKLASKLEAFLQKIMLVVNKTPSTFDHDDVRRRVSATYACDVAAVIPHSDELMTLASAGVFIMRHPKMALSKIYRALGEVVLEC